MLVARGADRLERVAAEIGGEVEVCDVGDRAAVDALATRIRERHGAVKLLVNNAGVPGRAGFLELPARANRERGGDRTTSAASGACVPSCRCWRQARPAAVVNVVSVAGTVSGGPSGPYSAAKHAQIAFSRSIGSELAPRGIRVYTVNPGLTQTEGFPQDRFLAHPVLRHAVVTPERVADAIVTALVRDRREVFVPGYYRVGGILAGARYRGRSPRSRPDRPARRIDWS